MSSIGDNWFEKDAILVKKSKKKKKIAREFVQGGFGLEGGW